jgi:hypothetical protein
MIIHAVCWMTNDTNAENENLSYFVCWERLAHVDGSVIKTNPTIMQHA